MVMMAPALGVSQLVCSTSCSLVPKIIPSGSSLKPRPQWAVSRKASLRIRAADKVEECNDEECAPPKEVGKLSMSWEAEEKTKITGTFPPVNRPQGKWTGYIEKDTAGQTNIYSVEPTIYVADSAISSGSAGSSSEGAENNLAIAGFLSLIAIAGASSVLISVTKNQPTSLEQEVGYSGPNLSYFIGKFTPEPTPVPAIVEASVQAAPEISSPPAVTVDETSTSTSAPATEAAESPATTEPSI
ncbi:hypothetical protein R1sor_015923 [Riccia sorocarpa]|uniref:Uncharacterized protein n=1 Tax=Riccia sorocarpa TaxID=122646 RepID=A0ABD3HJP9_9MARC